MPAFDGGDDFVGVCGPDEGFGVSIGFLDEAVDGHLQIDDGSEDAAFQPPVGQLGEVALGRMKGLCLRGDLASGRIGTYGLARSFLRED